MQDSYYEQPSIVYDQGLRKFMLGVFNNMTLALCISGLIAAFIGTTPELAKAIWGTPFSLVVIFAPLIMAFFIGFKIHSMTPAGAKLALYVFAGLMGLSLSHVFVAFTVASITQVFFITSATFGATALYGYTTKRDLSNMGTFLMMGLFGIIIAGLVNIFMQSSALQFAISCISVVIFVGFTAYDMQNIKQMYYDLDGEDRDRAGVIGALNLYLDFVNIFLSLLELVGIKKD